MRLQKLVLTNFKGVRSLEINAGGKDFTVRGRNGVGKTTVADAVTWLLFGKDTMDRTENNFGIKTKVDGEVLHNLEHTVEADYIAKGHEVTLKRLYKEKWTKQRGSNIENFTGHTTEYYINDVPKSQKEYNGYIASIIDEKVFKLLTSPLYFNDILKWEERRKILIDIAGDITTSEIMSTMDLTALKELLRSYEFDEIKKMAAEKKKKINEQLKTIPARIDELTRTMTGMEFPNRSQEKEELQQKITDVNNKIAEVKNGSALRGIEQDIRDLEMQEADLRRQWEEQEKGKTKEIRDEIEQEEVIHLARLQAMGNIGLDIKISKQDLEETTKRIERQKELLSKLKKQYIESKKETFMPPSDTLEQTCPTCGQKLPEDKIQEAKEKDIEKFNKHKATLLEDITEKGQIERKFLDDLEVKVKAINEKLALDNEKLEAETKKADLINAELEELMQKLKAVKVDLNGYKDTKGYNDILEAKKSANCKLKSLREGNADIITQANDDLEVLKVKMREIMWQEAQLEEQKKVKNRIAELEAQEKDLAAEFEKWQGVIYETEEFTKAKVEMLTQKIDSKFKIAKFKMFDEAINGGIKETCIATGKDGIAWNEAMNTGQKNNIGLDIINTLCEFYDFAPPIFIDNAESITEIPETKGQLVKLIHDGNVDKLTIEEERNEI